MEREVRQTVSSFSIRPIPAVCESAHSRTAAGVSASTRRFSVGQASSLVIRGWKPVLRESEGVRAGRFRSAFLWRETDFAPGVGEGVHGQLQVFG